MWMLFKYLLYLIPYDGLHILPTNYRPIVIYGLLIFFIIGFSKSHKIDKAEQYLWLFTIYAIAVTFISKLVNPNFGGIKSAIDFTIPLMMGTVSFSAFNQYFKLLFRKYGTKTALQNTFEVIGQAYYLPLVVGVLEELSLIGILPSEVKLGLNSFFGGWQVTRLNMTTTEASWVSMHLLFVIPIYIYLIKIHPRKKQYKVALITSFILFFCVLSLQGLATGIIGLLVYVLMYGLFNKNLLKILKILFIIVFIIFVVATISYFIVQNSTNNSYFIVRIKKFIDLNTLINTDGSSFMRICNPIIAMLIFLNFPIFGIGGDSFPFIYMTYLKRYFPYRVSDPYIFSIINNHAMVEISLFAKVLCSTGIIGTILYVMFLYVILRKIKFLENDKEIQSSLLLWSCIMMSVQLQFCSFAMIQYVIMLAIINNVNNKKYDYSKSATIASDLR